MKKLLTIVILCLFNCNVVFAEIGLNCFITSVGKKEINSNRVEYTELKPSQFTVQIEELGGGKVIARTFGSEQTGYICSPFIGDVTDARVKMKCFHDLKYPDAGTDFFLDRYTGKFRIESYLLDRKESWWRQYTGICKGVEKKF
tara:strand:- start:30 stop:461 length:432 start_codon:yes stop_codon:yes gene_type:complete